MSVAEWKLMRILWKLKAGAIGDILPVAKTAHEWSRSTVKTMLMRLADKGYVATTRVGNSFLYEPKHSPIKSLLQAADQLLENALDGTSGPILAHMIKKSELSEDEIEDLRRLLDQHTKPGKGKTK